MMPNRNDLPPKHEHITSVRHGKSLRRRNFSLESLESRTLFTTGLGVPLDQNTYVVAGTAGDDHFSLITGNDSHQITLNGQRESVPVGSFSTIIFDGLGGENSVEIVASNASDTIAFEVSSATVRNDILTVEVHNTTHIEIDAAGGLDTTTFADSPDSDRATLMKTFTRLMSDDFVNIVRRSELTTISSTHGGTNDRAHLYDTAGNDTLTLTPEQGVFNLAGGNQITAEGFRRTYGHAIMGGEDHAVLHDSQAADYLQSNADMTRIYNSAYMIRANGFETTVGVASDDGELDRAYFFDTGGDDTLSISPSQSHFVGDSMDSIVTGWNRIYATANEGWDAVSFVDSAGDDVFKTEEHRVRFYNDVFYANVKGFDKAVATATEGGYDKAYHYDTAGDDTLILTEDRVRMLGDSIDQMSVGFERGYAYSASGGNDKVRAYDVVFDSDFALDEVLEGIGGRDTIDAETGKIRIFNGNLYRRAEGFIVAEMLEYHPNNLVSNVGETGAVGVNNEWEAGVSQDYYIEMQRYGSELIKHGLAVNDLASVERGMQIIQWGLDQQQADGSFASSDQVHSTSMFLHAVAESIVELDRFQFEAFASVRGNWVESLEHMTNWMVDNAHLSADVDLEPFSHRYFLRASGLKLVAKITGNDTFSSAADDMFIEGMSLQMDDGTLPERGGFDVSYQALGLRYAGQYFELSTDPTQRAAIADMFAASLNLFAERIDADGQVDTSDSSRTDETSRAGTQKRFDFKNAVRGFLSAYEITGDTEWLDMGEAVYRAHYSTAA